MANYKVGDLDVTISGVSKDAVSSLDEVIKQLDKLQDKLGVVGGGFKQAFKSASSAATRAVVWNYGEVSKATESASDSQEKLAVSIGNSETRIKDYSSTINETNKALKNMVMTEQEKILADFQQANATRKQRIEYLNLMLATGQAGERTREFTEELKRLTKEQQKADKVAGKSSTGGFSKFLNRIGRIALYRTIRRGLQLVTQTFTESIQAYAQVDDSINKTMSQLTSSTKVIQLSLGTIIFPILQAITPVVEQISYGFSNMANAINASMAKMQGLTTYTKINAKALEDYRKKLNKTSGALFEFDKFRALNSGQEKSPFLETAEVANLNDELGDSQNTFNSIFDTLNNIGGLLSTLFETARQIIDAVATSPITAMLFEVAGSLIKIVSDVIQLLNESNLLKPVVNGILGILVAWGGAKVVGGLTTLFTKFNMIGVALGAVVLALGIIGNWDNFSEGTKKAITTISALIAVLTSAAIAALALNGALTFGSGVALALTAIAAGAVAVKGMVSAIPKYANGASDIDGGALFVAGEAGKTEMVYSGTNGKANVANVQQMYQADYMAHINALNEWWKTARYDIPQLQPASDTGIYQSAERGARKVGKKFANA